MSGVDAKVCVNDLNHAGAERHSAIFHLWFHLEWNA